MEGTYEPLAQGAVAWGQNYSSESTSTQCQATGQQNTLSATPSIQRGEEEAAPSLVSFP